MRTHLRPLAATAASLGTLAALALGAASPAAAYDASPAGTARSSATVDCFAPGSDGATGASASARGGFGNGRDHREVTRAEQRAIEARTDKLLKGKPGTGSGGEPGLAPQGGTIPTYVHVMAARNGTGDVTNSQITQQISVLNSTYSGTGFTFTLAGADRFYNDAYHADRSSSKYRSATRKGGANALNIWLVDFDYLGIATFPWDYSRNGAIDGIRVNYGSLPGGPIANYDQGKTATHEAGHWLGLYHTFQGGCTTTNDEVSDTPAQSSASSGCPEGRDSCSLPGLDPIHNYMDYSYDSCYTQFTGGQTSRMQQMFGAYRA